MKLSKDQIYQIEYKDFQIEIFLADVGYGFVIRKDDFEDIEKGHRNAKECLLRAKELIDAGEEFIGVGASLENTEEKE